jgi:hypothetical protein
MRWSVTDWLIPAAMLAAFVGAVLWLAKARQDPEPSSSSRGEEAKPKERNDKQHECAEGPNCDFCRGMAVNMALADIAEHEPDVRLIEQMVLAEEGQQ